MLSNLHKNFPQIHSLPIYKSKKKFKYLARLSLKNKPLQKNQKRKPKRSHNQKNNSNPNNLQSSKKNNTNNKNKTNLLTKINKTESEFLKQILNPKSIKSSKKPISSMIVKLTAFYLLKKQSNIKKISYLKTPIMINSCQNLLLMKNKKPFNLSEGQSK